MNTFSIKQRIVLLIILLLAVIDQFFSRTINLHVGDAGLMSLSSPIRIFLTFAMLSAIIGAIFNLGKIIFKRSKKERLFFWLLLFLIPFSYFKVIYSLMADTNKEINAIAYSIKQICIQEKECPLTLKMFTPKLSLVEKQPVAIFKDKNSSFYFLEPSFQGSEVIVQYVKTSQGFKLGATALQWDEKPSFPFIIFNIPDTVK